MITALGDEISGCDPRPVHGIILAGLAVGGDKYSCRATPGARMLHIRRPGRPARVLTLRLIRLVGDQIVTKREYALRPERFRLSPDRQLLAAVRHPARHQGLGRQVDDGQSRADRPDPPSPVRSPHYGLTEVE
jgi:hypothetical protein